MPSVIFCTIRVHLVANLYINDQISSQDFAQPSNMRLVAVLLFLATVFATCRADGYIEKVTQEIHLLRPRSGVADYRPQDVDCFSWHLAVETNNIRNWKLVPEECEQNVGHYMLGKQYRKIAKLWQTPQLNMPRASHLLVMGRIFGSLILTKLRYLICHIMLAPMCNLGTVERFKDIRISNIKAAGYHTWEKLILKGEADQGTSALVYKSKKRTELVNSGYRILGNMGDRWSDILGDNSGNRTFKVPDPMYYIG
ncbi:unnamed protein product [Fraxinus pennsylvanica]|uniref:Uncharacterized protein n=1 Tax=Fraxinus pennsylvanica TaxID=56036 RepID=A0AAD2ABE9_9LAMI|nr:unnamed protein product [Fraxinus pennsylvanica]